MHVTKPGIVTIVVDNHVVIVDVERKKKLPAPKSTSLIASETTPGRVLFSGKDFMPD